MTFYRVNIKVVVLKDKQAELLEAVKEKNACDDLQTYFGEHFGKTLTRSLSQAKKLGGAKDLSGSLLTCAVADERGDFVFNYGLQGPYEDLIRYLENSYVQSILKFISPYSKSMMYRPYDKEKKPHGDFYLHIGEGGFNFKLPHMKLVGATRTFKGEEGSVPKPVPATNSYSAVAKAAGAKARVSNLPPPPPLCPLGTVSQNLTYKMREAKKVEQEYAKAEADLKELQKKLKELAAKRTTLKGTVADLKKELKKLMEEEEDEEEDDSDSDEEDEEDSDSDEE